MPILLLKRSPQTWQPVLQRPWQIQSWCIPPSLHKHSTFIAASHLSQATIISRGKKESFYSFVSTTPGSSIRFGPHDSKRHMSSLHSFRSGTGMFSAPRSISLAPQSRVPCPVLKCYTRVFTKPHKQDCCNQASLDHTAGVGCLSDGMVLGKGTSLVMVWCWENGHLLWWNGTWKRDIFSMVRCWERGHL